MAKFLKVTDVWGEDWLININQVEGVSSGSYMVNDKKIPVWIILSPGCSIYISRELHDIDDIKSGLEGRENLFYGKFHKKEKEYEAKQKEEEQQEPVFEFPTIMDRYSFSYITPKYPFKNEAEDFVNNDEVCYFIDGNPLTIKAVKITKLLASTLLQSYGFNNPVRNLSWVEIDGHLALLFNNRAR